MNSKKEKRLMIDTFKPLAGMPTISLAKSCILFSSMLKASEFSEFVMGY